MPWNLVRTGPKNLDGGFYGRPDDPTWTGHEEWVRPGQAAGTGVTYIDEKSSLTVGGHWHGGTLVPTAAAGGNAGGSPPAPVVTQGSTDLAGTITFGTGSTPAAGLLVTVTFGRAWVIPGGGAMHVVLTANNAVTQALGIWCSNKSPTAFSLSTANAPAGGQANTTYSFDYIAVG